MFARWGSCPSAVRYEVQIAEVRSDRVQTGSEFGSQDIAEDQWSTISDCIKGTIVRKKNLKSQVNFVARVRYRDRIDWGNFSSLCAFQTLKVPFSVGFYCKFEFMPEFRHLYVSHGTSWTA